MAEIVQSLFGITPESYRATQQQQADAQALQYAKLDPFQQANFAIGRGATMLGGAIGGALGGQDPELQRITMRQQIARQLNPNDPASIEQGISALSQAGDSQGAMMLQAEYRKLVESRALVGQREASALASTAQATRERTQASPKEVQLAREVAALTGFEPGTPQYNTAYAESLREQMAPKPTAEAKPNIQKLQEYAATLPVGSVLRKQVEAAIDAESRGKGTTITNVLPGDKALVDIPGFRATVQKTIEPQLKAVDAADNALVNIQNSIDTGNFASFRAAQVQFAKAIAGAGDLSQKELTAAGADPALLGGTADYLSRLFTSTPTVDTQNKIKSTLQAIKKVSTDKANAEIDSQRKIALRNKGYDPEAVNLALSFPQFQTAPVAPQYATNPQTKERIMSTDGGKTWTPVR
jgi:hypothetical protein